MWTLVALSILYQYSWNIIYNNIYIYIYLSFVCVCVHVCNMYCNIFSSISLPSPRCPGAVSRQLRASALRRLSRPSRQCRAPRRRAPWWISWASAARCRPIARRSRVVSAWVLREGGCCQVGHSFEVTPKDMVSSKNNFLYSSLLFHGCLGFRFRYVRLLEGIYYRAKWFIYDYQLSMMMT